MKTIHIFIVILTCLLSTTACEDSFELKRPQETQWRSTATFEGGLSTAYWKTQWAPSGFMEYYDFMLSGVAMTVPGTNHHSEVKRRDFTQDIGWSKNFWEAYYQAITLSNLALEMDENENGNPFDLPETGDDYIHNYRRQIGEYHFLRAYAYYRLATWFAPPYQGNNADARGWIPLKTKAAASMEDAQSEKLGTLEEIYALVISDLKKAKEMLPEKFTLVGWTTASPGYETGRANKYVASAMLGKVYYHMGRYADAKAEFDYVINSNEFFLADRPCDPFINYRAEDVSSESIWEFNTGDVNVTQGQHNQYWYAALIYGFRFRDSNGSFYDNLPESGTSVPAIQISGWNGFTIAPRTLLQMGWINPADSSLTTDALADLRISGDLNKVYHVLGPYKEGVKKGTPEYLQHVSNNSSMTGRTNVYIDKFFRGADAPFGRYSKVPLIRLSELLLLRAVVNYKDGALQAAADDANRVWNRSNPANLDKFNAGNIDQDAIYDEFLRELMGEGSHILFLQGAGMTIPEGEDAELVAVNPPYADWHWPIPAIETSLNPNYQ